LRPWGFASLSAALFDVARSKSTSGLTEGVFNKMGNITLYAEQIDYTTGDLTRVVVDDKRNENQRKIVIAKRGRIIADENTHSISLLLRDGVGHELLQGRYSRTDFNANSLIVDSSELQNDSSKGINARELATPELSSAIDEYRASLKQEPRPESYTVRGEEMTRKELEKKLRRAKMELGQRFSLPYASFVMAFIGMAFGIMSPRTQRTWGAGFAAALGLSVFIVYYSVLSIGLALADSGAVNVWIALWLPNVIATVVAMWSVYKIGTEQWQSVSEGVYAFYAALSDRFRRREVRA
jgi:lipopolysaccharide export system permease protein